jgi:hypothetical protein
MSPRDRGDKVARLSGITPDAYAAISPPEKMRFGVPSPVDQETKDGQGWSCQQACTW